MEQVAANTATTAQAAEAQTPTLDMLLAEYEEIAELEDSAINIFKDCIKGNTVTVSSEAQASEIARRITRAEAEVERVTAIADAMVEAAQRKLKNLEGIFMTPLSIWTSARLAGQKARSLILPGGKLALRKIPEATHYVDQQKTIEWAQQNLAGAIKLVPKIETDVVKAFEEANNTVAPGREKRAGYDSFSVTVPKAK